MIDDYKVDPRSAKNIELLTLAWRDRLGVPNIWAPDMLRLLEIELPKIPKLGQFALITRSELEMGDAEAYTEFNPPHIVVRNSVYQSARKADGRSRMTLAHELGHLVMHPGAAKLRSEWAPTNTRLKPFESAEWQANKFASLFLMPLHVIREFTSPSQLAESCQVSQQAAQIRFGEFAHIAKPLPDCIAETLDQF
jgi:Zn-dependent peptidase ImmA (M78 family)